MEMGRIGRETAEISPGMAGLLSQGVAAGQENGGQSSFAMLLRGVMPVPAEMAGQGQVAGEGGGTAGLGRNQGAAVTMADGSVLSAQGAAVEPFPAAAAPGLPAWTELTVPAGENRMPEATVGRKTPDGDSDENLPVAGRADDAATSGAQILFAQTLGWQLPAESGGGAPASLSHETRQTAVLPSASPSLPTDRPGQLMAASANMASGAGMTGADRVAAGGRRIEPAVPVETVTGGTAVHRQLPGPVEDAAVAEQPVNGCDQASVQSPSILSVDGRIRLPEAKNGIAAVNASLRHAGGHEPTLSPPAADAAALSTGAPGAGPAATDAAGSAAVMRNPPPAKLPDTAAPWTEGGSNRFSSYPFAPAGAVKLSDAAGTSGGLAAPEPGTEWPAAGIPAALPASGPPLQVVGNVPLRPVLESAPTSGLAELHDGEANGQMRMGPVPAPTGELQGGGRKEVDIPAEAGEMARATVAAPAAAKPEPPLSNLANMPAGVEVTEGDNRSPSPTSADPSRAGLQSEAADRSGELQPLRQATMTNQVMHGVLSQVETEPDPAGGADGPDPATTWSAVDITVAARPDSGTKGTDRERDESAMERTPGGSGNGPAVLLHSGPEAAEPSTRQMQNRGGEPSQPLHESILSQVREGVIRHDGRGNGEMTVRLAPDSLGELQIKVRVEDQRVKIEVLSENRTVREALLGNLDLLKETLLNQNLTMDKFHVSTGGGGGFAQMHRDDGGMERKDQRHPYQGETVARDLPREMAADEWGAENALVNLRL